jgi:hypothetical protein
VPPYSCTGYDWRGGSGTTTSLHWPAWQQDLEEVRQQQQQQQCVNGATRWSGSSSSCCQRTTHFIGSTSHYTSHNTSHHHSLHTSYHTSHHACRYMSCPHNAAVGGPAHEQILQALPPLRAGARRVRPAYLPDALLAPIDAHWHSLQTPRAPPSLQTGSD